MSLKKYILIYYRLDDLIKQHSTGCPDELAEKLNLSKRQVFNYLKDIRELGFKIEYSVVYNSYVYIE